MIVRMNENQESYDAASEGFSEDPILLKNPSVVVATVQFFRKQSTNC